MAPRIVDKEAKRQMILKAALKVFARKGLNDFKVIEVAEAAGVGKGTIYEYFPSKDDLIVGCFSQFMLEFDHHIAAQLAELTDPAEKIRRLVSAMFEFCYEDPLLMQALFDFYAAGIPRRDGKSLLTGLAPMYRQMIDHVAAIIDEGVAAGTFRPVNSTLVSSAVLALLDGLFFQIALGVIKADAGPFAERISDLLLTGLNKTDKE
jgi:TetR/AcrR family fatty acid metabolism transcriptional regulator